MNVLVRSPFEDPPGAGVKSGRFVNRSARGVPKADNSDGVRSFALEQVAPERNWGDRNLGIGRESTGARMAKSRMYSSLARRWAVASERQRPIEWPDRGKSPEFSPYSNPLSISVDVPFEVSELRLKSSSPAAWRATFQ